MGRRHADDASGIPVEYLTGEIFGAASPSRAMNRHVVMLSAPLPRVRDGNQYALSAVSTFYVKPRSVFRCIGRSVEIGKFGTLIMAACECQYKQQYQAQIFQCFHIVTNLYLRISSYFSELRGDADEQFEVDTGHGAREHRKVVLVEEIIDCKFQLNVHRFEKQVFSKETLLMKYSGRCPVSV